MSKYCSKQPKYLHVIATYVAPQNRNFMYNWVLRYYTTFERWLFTQLIVDRQKNRNRFDHTFYTMAALSCKLLPLIRSNLSNKTICLAHTVPISTVRTFKCVPRLLQLQSEQGSNVLSGKVDRFGGVTVNLGDSGFPSDINESVFSNLLQGLL